MVPELGEVVGTQEEIDLAAVQHGGRIIDCSDRFFSAPQNLLMPAKSSGMHDGWETRRRRGPGHDWVTLRLGVTGRIRSVEVDTSFFKGNFPESCSLETCVLESSNAEATNCCWRELLPPTKLRADSIERFEVVPGALATHVRFNIYPDGGVARLRIHGVPDKDSLMQARLRWLNSLPDYAARSVLLNCCGSLRWADAMTGSRPFSTGAALLDAHVQSCERLTAEDWKEAFAAHPQIGEHKETVSSGQAQRWSRQEQSSVVAFAAPQRKALQLKNGEYYSRFGYMFIVCASGKSAEEILAMLRERLHNDPARELELAAAEQNKITQLRLQKLIGAQDDRFSGLTT